MSTCFSRTTFTVYSFLPLSCVEFRSNLLEFIVVKHPEWNHSALSCCLVFHKFILKCTVKGPKVAFLLILAHTVWAFFFFSYFVYVVIKSLSAVGVIQSSRGCFKGENFYFSSVGWGVKYIKEKLWKPQNPFRIVIRIKTPGSLTACKLFFQIKKSTTVTKTICWVVKCVLQQKRGTLVGVYPHSIPVVGKTVFLLKQVFFYKTQIDFERYRNYIRTFAFYSLIWTLSKVQNIWVVASCFYS